MWCEAYVQSLRLALLPAELSISKMSKSQNLKMHRTQNSQRKVDCKRREKVVNDFDQRSLARTSFNIRIPHPQCASWLRRSRLAEALLTQERVQIASDQKLEADALNTAGQVRDRGGHVLGEEKLTSTLNVVPSATFRGPSAAHQYR